MADAGSLKHFQECNDRMSTWLERLRPDQEGRVSLTEGDLAELLADLQSAGEVLRASVGRADVRRSAEWSEYRATLEHLQSLLSGLATRLLAERAHLDHESAHLQAAASWAEANKESL